MLIPFVLKLSLCIFSIMLFFPFGLEASLSNFSFDWQLLIGLAIRCNYFSFWYQFLNVRFVLLYFFHLGQSCYWIFRLFKCFFFLVLYTYVVIISLEIFFLLPHYSRHPNFGEYYNNDFDLNHWLGIAVPPRMAHNHTLQGVSYQLNSKTTFQRRWPRLFSNKVEFCLLNSENRGLFIGNKKF